MRSTLFIALGLAAVLAAIFITLYSDDETAETIVERADTSSQPEARSSNKSASSTSDETPQAVSSPLPEKSEEVTVEKIIPAFDVVRIDKEGDAVIAGRAEPNSSVSIMDGDTVLGTAKADDRGEWVFLPHSPLNAGDRELSLRAENPDGSVENSQDVVVLVVPERDGDALAVSMSRDGKGLVKALQTPDADQLALAINAVNYDDEGQLSISGTAPNGAAVFLYLDNDFLGNATTNDKGQWSLSPSKQVAAGVYELRADHVDEFKKVLNRVSIPFARADEDMKNIPEDRKFVVQPGNSLWRIARRIYGTGFDYAVIYRANKDQIVDPDLIYPGQVFELPIEQ